jgi:hypothetical protein
MLSVAPSLDALGSSSLRIPKCHFLSGEFPTNIIKVLLQKEKAEDFSPASFWLVPSPRHFAKLETYCNGETVAVQVAMAAELYRTTASANEQKYRTPVWFGANGAAVKV